MDSTLSHPVSLLASAAMSPDDLVGVSEIARMGGVALNSAWRWTKRDDFPAPTATLAAGRVWRRREVEKWLAKPRPRGRPPVDR